MCLTVLNNLEIKITEKDIVCYKVVMKVFNPCFGELKNTFISPFQAMKIKLDEEYTEPDFTKTVTKQINK